MTVGERLREARERRGISLRQIAEETNVSVRSLEAIERNELDKLPGGIFTRGFIRSYASAVGLDPDGVVKQFLQDEPGQRIDLDEMADEPVGSDSSRRWMIVAGVVIAMAAVAAAVYVLGLRADLR